jgi:NAD(P)-dependent dehydrogenase (short-subunit alcohol dehydrogenase family)
MNEFRGRTAFVTGAASGIGLGLARTFLDRGMNVMMADVETAALQAAVHSLSNYGDHVASVLCDVSVGEAIADAAARTIERFGKVHILCNNAGVGVIGPIKITKFGDWDWALSVMIGGVVNGLQLFLPRILKHGEGGHILTTSSMGGVLPLSESVIYSTTKAAVIGMCEALRGALAEDNIGVSAFCPGPVTTNIRETGRYRPEQYRKDSGYAEFEKELAKRPDSPNWMSIEECGERVLNGIRRNDLYIFTHREFKEGVAERMEAMLASFPDEEINQVRAKEISFLTSNPIFKEARLLSGKERS